MTEDKTYRIISQDVQQFLSLCGPYTFTNEQIDRQYNIKTREGKHNRWKILERMVDSGRLIKLGTGKYRLVDPTLEEIDWQTADVQNIVKVFWPLELHKYIKTYHKSINIIAGAPGAGKTAFLYDFILRNMHHKMGMVLFTNDMSPEEIKERMINSDTEIPSPPPFKVYDRADNFSDVIESDKINVRTRKTLYSYPYPNANHNAEDVFLRYPICYPFISN